MFSHEVIGKFNERRHHPLPVMIRNVFLLLRLLIQEYTIEDKLFEFISFWKLLSADQSEERRVRSYSMCNKFDRYSR